MKEKLSKIMDEALSQIEASGELEKLNDIRVAFLGKKGELTSVLKGMKDVAPEDRPKVGQLVNEARPDFYKVCLDNMENKILNQKFLNLPCAYIDINVSAKLFQTFQNRHPHLLTYQETVKPYNFLLLQGL